MHGKAGSMQLRSGSNHEAEPSQHRRHGIRHHGAFNCECRLVGSPGTTMTWDESLTAVRASSTPMVDKTAVQAMLACRPAAITGCEYKTQ